MKFRIANKIFLIKNEDNKELDLLLTQLLCFYEPADNKSEDIEILFTNEDLAKNIKYYNPKIHGEFENGFLMSVYYGQIGFTINNDIPTVKVNLNNEFYNKNIISKFISNGEFSSALDKLSSIFYESIIIPSLFFFDDLALIHSAGVCDANGNGIVLGGTGGIGKTSMEIELCYYDKYKFVNDDIGIVDSNGMLFPNYAYPKIYGYNLEGYPKLKNEIFSQRSIVDKF